VRKLVGGRRARDRDAEAVHASRLHRVVARILAATVPKNASGNNASVR
jgi:hypothetical protein